MKKTFLVIIVILTIIILPTAQAGDKWKHKRHGGQNKFYDYARVVDVEPVFRTVRISTPERNCWREEVRRPKRHRTSNDATGSMIVGGIIGGVVGHHIGDGRGRDVATVAGSIVGAAIGHDMAAYNEATTTQVRYEKHCRTEHNYHKEKRIDGYRVTYRYKGEIFKTRMDYDPGRRIKVMVKVVPIDD